MTTYVESDSKVRTAAFAAVAGLVTAGVLLKYYAMSLPHPTGGPALELRTAADRALLASILATVLYAMFAGFVLWLTVRTVQSKQWPPLGMRVPVRTKVRQVRKPALAWSLVVVVLSVKAYVVALYWQLYLHLDDLAELVAK